MNIKKSVIIGGIAAATLLPISANSQTKNDTTKKDLIENLDQSKDTIDYEKVKDMRCNQIIDMYGENGIDVIKNSVYKQINEIREKNNLPLLEKNDILYDLAQSHATYMSKNNWYRHEDKNNISSKQRAKFKGYKYYRGENIDKDGFGQTPANLIAKWMGHTLHRDLILDRSCNEIGIGFSEYKEKNEALPYNFFVIEMGYK